MSSKSKTAVFFGSGPVAAASLALLIKHVPIEAVVTKPSTLYEMSKVAPGVAVFTVKNKQELDDLLNEQSFASKYGIIIDFGIIVSREAIDYFELGIINSHFSLLPQWRGADPITFAVLSGQEITGVSLMLLNEKLDEGKIIAQGECHISEQDTTPSLTNKLMLLSDALLKNSLAKYISGQIKPISQRQAAQNLGRSTEATYSRKLLKEDGVLDPNKSAAELEREVRAFLGWPGSRVQLKSITITVNKAKVSDNNTKFGELTAANKRLYFGCKGGSLEILELKPSGKKNMSASAFLNGYTHYLS